MRTKATGILYTYPETNYMDYMVYSNERLFSFFSKLPTMFTHKTKLARVLHSIKLEKGAHMKSHIHNLDHSWVIQLLYSHIHYSSVSSVLQYISIYYTGLGKSMNIPYELFSELHKNNQTLHASIWYKRTLFCWYPQFCPEPHNGLLI